MEPELKTRQEMVTDAIRRLVTYAPSISHYGPTSAALGLVRTIAGSTSSTARLYRATKRRISLMAATGEALVQVAADRGAQKLPAQRAGVFVILVPHSARVTAITSGATDAIEVSDSTAFEVSDSIRIRDSAGNSEIATITAINSGTGPNSGDELVVASLSGSYTPSTTADDVTVLLRHTITEGTQLTSRAGVSFSTTAAVTIGDANPLFDGESTFLGLADKVWCECDTAGEVGNVDPISIDGFAVTDDKVLGVYNPERGEGGAEEERDFDLKRRAAHGPTRASQETESWLEAVAQDADLDVLRAVRVSTSSINTMAMKVLHRNGSALGSSAKLALKAFVEQRVRSHLSIEVDDITLTSVEVVAQATLDPNTTLLQAWRAAAQRLAEDLDYRKLQFGDDPDEATLLSTVKNTPGIATLVTSTFQPASNVEVAADSLPRLTRFSLEDVATGNTIDATIQVSF